MKHLKSTSSDLRQIFEQAITVSHIAETLEYRNADDEGAFVRQYMEQVDFDVLGVETAGIVDGYVRRDDLQMGKCGDYKQIFHPAELIAESTPLIAAMGLLKDKPRFFVLVNNRVKGIVTRGDLQKAAVRMLIFGLVTLIEMNLLKLIRNAYPGDTWQDKLTPAQLKKAIRLFSQRMKRNEAIDLADCLQLGDKFDLLSQHDRLPEQLELCIDKLNDLKEESIQLRNLLAHGQDLVAGSSWDKLIDTVDNMERLLLQIEAPMKTVL